MTLQIEPTAVTQTSVTFGVTGRAADGTIEYQVSSTADFQFSIAPVLSVAEADSFSVTGLNQRGTYYARARARRAGGNLEGGWSDIKPFRTTDGAARTTIPAAIAV